VLLDIDNCSIEQQSSADFCGQGIDDDYVAIDRLDDSSDVDHLRDLQVHQGGGPY
jgi:hypothetical protein